MADLNLTIPGAPSSSNTGLNTVGSPSGSNSFTGIQPMTVAPKTNITGMTVPPTTTTTNTGLANNGQNILSTTEVNTTPTATTLSTVKPVTIPTTPPSNVDSSLAATSDSYMTKPGGDPSNKYNTDTGAPNPNYPGYKPPGTDNTTNTTSDTGIGGTGATRNDLLSKYLGLENTLGDQAGTRDTLNSQFGVDPKQQAYINAFNQYQSKKVAYDQQIESLYNQPGVTREQADQQVKEISRQNNADLANLAVITTAAQGNYQGALDIVQRKIDAEFKPVQQQIDNLSQFLQTNNADLTDSQKTQLENTRFQLQTNMTNLITAKQSAHQFALQQGIQDPNVLAAIDKAQTPADVYAAVGGNANGLPQGGTTPNVSPQYAGYQAQTVNGAAYVPQEKLTNLTPYQQQEAARQYSAAGIPVLTSGQTVVIQNVDTTRQNLNDLNAVTSKILGSGATGRVGSSIANWLGGTFQTNPDVAAFNNYRQLAIGALKSLGAGTGGSRITSGEIQTAQDNLPTIYDSLETAQKKSAILSSQLDKWQNELLPGSVGSTNSGGGGLYDW